MKYSTMMVVFVLLVGILPALVSCEYFPFMNDSLPWDERLDDLMSRLTLDDMTLQMARGGSGPNGPAPPIPRLGIGPYDWDTECLRGDVKAGNATSYPQALGLAASFSTQLLHDVAQATGQEVRAKHNNLTQHGIYKTHGGLSCFSPVINIMRHPLWGRNQETYGEDPFLSGELARAFVTGLQGNNSRYVLANAGCKHFAAYAGPENYPVSRFSFNAVVSDRDLFMTFLPQFHECVKAGSYSIMCSYNSINGVPACANTRFLRDILRKQFGFKGYVVSDELALEFIRFAHNYTNSTLESAVVAVKAGVNLDLSSFKQVVYLYITEAVEKDLISLGDVFALVRPLFYTRMRLGEFDPPARNPYTKLRAEDVVESIAHQNLAIEAAVKSFVLLKNNGVLPLKSIGKLAVVGPFGNDSSQLFGDYAPDSLPRYITTPLQGLESIADMTSFAAGCDNPKCTGYNQSSVVNAVSGADFVVVCLGSGTSIESEGRDRRNLALPGHQLQLLQDAVKNASGKPVVLLLFTAGPFDISWAVNNPDVSVIVQCFLPAQATGVAIRHMFTNYQGTNPAGRLPYTWPASMDQVPPMTNYSMVNRTYRYFSGTPFYQFGYGLSYTKFQYSQLVVKPDHIMPCDDVFVNVTLKNVGAYSGDEVVQVYIKWSNATVPVPKIQLAAFERINTASLKTVSVVLYIPARVRAVYTDRLVLQPGAFTVFAGGQQPSPSIGGWLSSNVMTGSFQVDGSETDLAKCQK
ncbi:beta-xylosidase/alpha-L-arabinofuranosidase 2-like [Patiria miniata]|uniref:Fibronectin type III-like domain-containing protein n=1 Tax=Patiria miniata TaxID=46514 RepID=A0A914BBY7_PATMI|nr:beta-xylosidase/alpha-L-arabinofuranosidase 2-like [Patiria miniata]